MSPFHCFLSLLNGLFEKYSLSGLIDLSVGTGMSHLGLAQILGELRTITSGGSVTVEQDELLGAYVVLLRQLLHNVGADDDLLVLDHLSKVRTVMDPSYVSEPVEERVIDGDKFRKEDVLSIIHAAIA